MAKSTKIGPLQTVRSEFSDENDSDWSSFCIDQTDFPDNSIDSSLVRSSNGRVLKVITAKSKSLGPPPPLPIPSDAIGYQTYVIEDFKEWPQLEWMVEGLFHEGSLVMVWGASGAGKTAWLIDLVISISTGATWAGRRTKLSHVMFCAMEGTQGFRERFIAANQHHDARLRNQVRFIFDPVDLTDSNSIDGLAKTIARFSITLVIIDTLAAALAGKVDENSNQHMAGIVDNARRLSQMTGATVLLSHHTGHDTRSERGATAMRAGVDTSISINRRKGNRFWQVVKQRDGGEGFGGYFELVPYPYEIAEGVSVESVVITHGGAISNASVQFEGDRRTGRPGIASRRDDSGNGNRITENQRKVLAKFEDLASRMNSPDGVPLPRVVEECSSCLGMAEPKRRNQRTKEALKALVSRGRLIELPSGNLQISPG